MIKRITFKKDYRCFKQGESFNFVSGVNLLVGDQGTGKSTIFECLSNKKNNRHKILEIEADQMELLSFDFEKDNIRKRGALCNDKAGMEFQLASMFSSHGQSNLTMLSYINQTNNKLFCIDEPDMALSIRSCTKLIKMMKKSTKSGNQILASIHNPIIISAFDRVLSLDHKCWINSDEFIKSQLT